MKKVKELVKKVWRNKIGKIMMISGISFVSLFFILGFSGALDYTPEELARIEQQKAEEQARLEAENNPTPTLTLEYFSKVLKGKEFENMTVAYNEDENVLGFKMSTSSNYSTDVILGSNSTSIKEVLKKVQDTKLLKDEDKVKFTIMGNTTDKYGNKSEGVWLTISFKGEDVNRANFDNLYYEDIYRLAEGVGMLPSLREDIKSDSEYAFLKKIR